MCRRRKPNLSMRRWCRGATVFGRVIQNPRKRYWITAIRSRLDRTEPFGGAPMRWISVAVLTAAAAGLAVATGEAGVVVRRTRTRITVTRRSYLDPGTEVYPGSQNYTGYVFSPSYGSPAHSILGPGRPEGQPVPGTSPFWNPSYRVPNWGY